MYEKKVLLNKNVSHVYVRKSHFSEKSFHLLNIFKELINHFLNLPT